MEIIPGLLNGMGASSGFSPYNVYNSGENAIKPNELTIPTTIEAAIPLAVVRFQKRSMIIAGRFADAATAKANPTRNETFIPLKSIPSRMAIPPMTNAEILPARTFWRSSILI